MQASVGIHAERLLPPYTRSASRHGSSDAKRLRSNRRERRQACSRPASSSTWSPTIGQDIVKVLRAQQRLVHDARRDALLWGAVAPPGQRRALHARPRGTTSTSSSAKCEAPARDIVVRAADLCLRLKRRLPIYVPGPDAELVAAHTFDPSEYLIAQHRGDGGSIATPNSPVRVPETVTYHLACHLRAQNIGFKGRDLLALTGAKRQARRALLGDRRHVGLPRRELRARGEGGASARP